MNIRTYEEYSNEKLEFIKKHNFDYTLETSPMDEYGQYYYKTYSFLDGAQWFEFMRPVWERFTVEVKRTGCTVDVKLFETEFYDSENPHSRYYYENFS